MGPGFQPRQSSSWACTSSHCALPPPFLIGLQGIFVGWRVTPQTVRAGTTALEKSNIYTIHKISVLEWQLAVDKVWHFQINFYRFLSPGKRTRVWWIKPALTRLGSCGESRPWGGSAKDGREGSGSCMLSERKTLPWQSAALSCPNTVSGKERRLHFIGTWCFLPAVWRGSCSTGLCLGTAMKLWIFMWPTHKIPF